MTGHNFGDSGAQTFDYIQFAQNSINFANPKKNACQYIDKMPRPFKKHPRCI